MRTEDRNFYVGLAWHVVVAGFVIYETVIGQLAMADGLLALTTVAGLALPSTIGGKPSAPPAP